MKKEKLGFQIKEDVEKDEIQLRPSQSKAVFKLISLNTEEEYTLMHQSPGHIQRRTPYNF